MGLEGLDSLGATDISLGHNKLNITLVDALIVNLLVVLIRSSIGRSGRSFGSLVSILEDILSSLELRLQAAGILGLTLAENNVGIRDQGLEDIGLGDGQQRLTGAADRDAGNALDLDETELGESLAGLDLTAGLGSGRGRELLSIRLDLLNRSGLVLDIGPIG